MIDVAFIFLTAQSIVIPEGARPEFKECLEAIAADPVSGRLAAEQWVGDGGGADAHYCRATADIANGYFSLGAQRLEEIAERKDAGDDLDRAELYAQAARTWLKDKNLEFADHALARAIDLAPDAIALNLVAAEIASAEEEWLDVVEHVSRAEDNGIVSSDAYVLRGRALMALGDTESAADDVVRALSLDERNIDALILRGELQQAGVIIEVFVENASAAHD